MNISRPLFRNRYKEEKSSRQTAHGGISISRGPRSKDYFERQSRERKQDLAYARPSARESFRGKGVGESSISRAAGSQPLSLSLSVYDLTGTGSTTAYLESTLCPLTKRGKVEVQVCPPIWRMYSVIYSATGSRESRSLANSCEILRTRKTCLTVSFTGIHAAVFKAWWKGLR